MKKKARGSESEDDENELASSEEEGLNNARSRKRGGRVKYREASDDENEEKSTASDSPINTYDDVSKQRGRRKGKSKKHSKDKNGEAEKHKSRSKRNVSSDEGAAQSDSDESEKTSVRTKQNRSSRIMKLEDSEEEHHAAVMENDNNDNTTETKYSKKTSSRQEESSEDEPLSRRKKNKDRKGTQEVNGKVDNEEDCTVVEPVEDIEDDTSEQNNSEKQASEREASSEEESLSQRKKSKKVKIAEVESNAGSNTDEDCTVVESDKESEASKQDESSEDEPLSKRRKNKERSKGSADSMEGSENQPMPSKKSVMVKLRNIRGDLNDEDIALALSDSNEYSNRRRKTVKYDENSDDEEPRNGKKKNASDDDNYTEDDEEEEDDDDGKSLSEVTESDSPPSKRSRNGLENRRSGRERKTIEKYEPEVKKSKGKRSKYKSTDESEPEDDSDSDFGKSRKRKRQSEPKKKKKKKLGYKKGSKSSNPWNRQQEDSNGEVESEGADEYEHQYKQQVRSKKKHSKDTPKKKLGSTTGRERKKVSYQVESSDASHSEDFISGAEEADEEEVEVVDIEGVDQIVDHRQGRVGATGEATSYFEVRASGDPNSKDCGDEAVEHETQFLVKWQGLAHYANTWESQASLDARKKGSTEVKGLRKVVNYQNKLSDYNIWKKRANPEDIEYQEIDIEMGRALIETYIEAERIFSRRKAYEVVDGKRDYEYYVKWRNLPYVEATWEPEATVKAHYSLALAEFKQRKRAKTDPRDYKESIRGIKKKFTPMKEQPDYIGSETLQLRDYQLDGINFVLRAWHKGNSLILADEMGLGKTIQTITFLQYLFYNYSFKGPMLVCVPLSTIAAWQKEFKTWAPDINTITYIGDAKTREIIRDFECENEEGELSFNALLTSYEMVSKDREFFADIVWSNVVVDEAHRLKSDDSLLYKVLTQMESHHRLLLTGTPLQNNLRELWCLLNYLRLEEIDDWESFEEDYGTEEDRAGGYQKLHILLKPYIIRRLKKDVEKSLPGKVEQILRVDMTIKQKKIYKLVLTKNYAALSKAKNQISLMNIMMQLRKTCNHVELMQEVEDTSSKQTSEERLQQIISGSGKVRLLDKLLTRFKEDGDRVLIFSQMVIMLNIVEEYLSLRRFPYQRLDGSVSAEKRRQSIAQFNAPGSKDFAFLLSTKAGGLGINLQTANRVIIYDSDFNPQNDLQAIARAHRIGQKNEVKIFRLVASCSVDEDIIQRAKNKMVLDHLVIQNMDTTGKTVLTGKKSKKGEENYSKDELNTIIKFGAVDLFNNDGEEGAEEQDKEVDLDAILKSAELREEEEAPQSEANKELLSAFKCVNVAFEENEQEVEQEKKEQGWDAIIPAALRAENKTKVDFEGLELYSDTEDLYMNIASRRKKRGGKVKSPKKAVVHNPDDVGSGNDGKDSDYNKSADNEDEDSDDSDEIDSDNAAPSGKKTVPIKSLSCSITECKREYADPKMLVRHMADSHKMHNYIIAEEDYINLPEVKSDKDFCFPCSKPLGSKIGYQIHINIVHGGKEPVTNYDVEKRRELFAKRQHQGGVSRMARDLVCLECGKFYLTPGAVKTHMAAVHNILDYTPIEENYMSLPEVQSTLFRCFPCGTKSFNKIAYRLHIKQKHNRVEPPPNYDPVKIANYENLTKMMVCVDCKERLSDPNAVIRHMHVAHGKEGYMVTDENYHDLPEVKAPHNNCRLCMRSFTKSVLYRLHIKNKHKGVEPPQNLMTPQRNTSNGRAMAVHTPGARPMESFACQACSKACPSQMALTQHLKLESPQCHQKVLANLLHVCEHCKKPCGTANNLYRHYTAESPKCNKAVLLSGLPPSISISKVGQQNGASPGLKKGQCSHCGKTFGDKTTLNTHLTRVHKVTPPNANITKMFKEEYLALPNIQSPLERCLPCQSMFPNTLRYKLHIRDQHKGEEPAENFAPENCPGDKELKCLMCLNMFMGRKNLRSHIQSVHLGLNSEEEKEEKEEKVNKEEKDESKETPDEETDPLADPLSLDDVPKTDEVENNTSQTGGESEIKDVTDDGEKSKPVEANDDETSKQEEKDEDIVEITEEKGSVKEAKIIPKELSEADKTLINKMLHLLKRYPCAFCSNRFDTKFALGHHEREHLQDPTNTPWRNVPKAPKVTPTATPKATPKAKEKKKTVQTPVLVVEDGESDEASEEVKTPPTTPKKKKKYMVVEDALNESVDDGSPSKDKIRKNTKMSAVQEHGNTTGPVCFKCGLQCKDHSNLKNHILSHFYREFDPYVPKMKPFNCPECEKPSRDKITMIRHYAFTHQKLFELTDLKPEQLSLQFAEDSLLKKLEGGDQEKSPSKATDNSISESPDKEPAPAPADKIESETKVSGIDKLEKSSTGSDESKTMNSTSGEVESPENSVKISAETIEPKTEESASVDLDKLNDSSEETNELNAVKEGTVSKEGSSENKTTSVESSKEEDDANMETEQTNESEAEIDKMDVDDSKEDEA